MPDLTALKQIMPDLRAQDCLDSNRRSGVVAHLDRFEDLFSGQ
jgi:hypothetical protein